MIQLIPRVRINVSYATATDYWSVNDGSGTLSSTFGANVARIPLPWPTTVRNLLAISRDVARGGDAAFALLKNNSPSALAVTLPAASDGPVADLVNAVSFAALDDFSYRVVATSVGFPGNTFGVSFEAESAGNIFGIAAVGGSASVGFGGVGGALGNGRFESYDNSLPTTRSNTYSICYVPGNLTRLAMKSFGTGYSGGSWIGHYILNGVVQDGSDGTVDTRCELLDGDATALASFVLPLIKGDHVDAAYYRTGTFAAFELANIAIGVGFVPTIPGRFMLTGGSNNIVGTPTGYVWVTAEQSVTDEGLALAPIGPSGLRARGLYIERGSPGPGETFVHTLRHNEGPTAHTVTLADEETSGLIEEVAEDFAYLDTISMQSIASAGANASSRLHWGLEASIAGVGPSGAAVIGPHQRIVFPRTQPEGVS